MRNWYDLPTYYDVSFSYDMADELAFINNVFRKFIKSDKPKILEPACGTGRLLIPLIKKGFDCTGFDLNKNALTYLKHKLEKNSLHANIKYDDMINFSSRKKYDGIYCTVDTFRHILSEKSAIQHLENITKVLKKNGIYILGLHLIPKKKKVDKVIKWTSKRGRLTVKTIMSMIKLDKKKRRETLEVQLKIKRDKSTKSYISKYSLRTYTLEQLLSTLDKIIDLEIINIYDEYYDISKPITLNSNSDYAVLLLRKK